MHSTERAALRLALGSLRRSLPRCREATPAAVWLYSAGAIDWSLRTAMVALASADAGLATAAEAAAKQTSVNVWIVRVCLYLRAVLRADAGDEWRGYVCRHWRWPEEVYLPAWPRSDAYERVRLAVPLWSQAPTRAP